MLNQRALRLVRKLFILLVMSVSLLLTSTSSPANDFPTECQEECNWMYEQCLRWNLCDIRPCSGGTLNYCHSTYIVQCYQNCTP